MTDHDPLEGRIARLERRLDQLEWQQRMLDRRLATVENSIVFRMLRRVGARVAASPLRGLLAGLIPPAADAYSAWLETLPAQPQPVPAACPRFSLLLAAPPDSPGEWREELIASVRGQSYPHWELWIAGDSGAVNRLAPGDARIHVHPENTGLLEAVNQAAALAGGDYLIVLGPDGRLDSDALAWLAAAAPADLLYTDEDRLDARGRRISPLFKPDWSPDLLLSCMYLGSLVAVSSAAWHRAGGLRAKCEDAALYDLTLRITDGPAVVRHVPRVLHHRHGPAAPLLHGRLAVEDALGRRGLNARVEDTGTPGGWQLRWPSTGALASLIICSRSPRLLKQCLRALQDRAAYPRYEVIVVQHLGGEDAELRAVIQRYGALCVPYAGPFDFARMNNLGARAASGDVLVFLNDDVEPLEGSWLDRLAAQAQRPDVGAAGARLLYPSGRLQHAGVVVGLGDGCGHPGRAAAPPPYWPWLNATRDVAAVTGACLAIRASLFRELGGFSEEFPVNYNDVDLCLRARQAGYRIVYDHAALLRHRECQTRRAGVAFEERRRWYGRWNEIIEHGDPYYNPHLTRAYEDLSLRSPQQ